MFHAEARRTQRNPKLTEEQREGFNRGWRSVEGWLEELGWVDRHAWAGVKPLFEYRNQNFLFRAGPHFFAWSSVLESGCTESGYPG